VALRFAALALAVPVVALATEAAPAQGCSRCSGAPIVETAPPSGFGWRRPLFFEHYRRRETSREIASLNPSTKSEASIGGGGSYSVCVRTCDGSFFPVATAGVNRADLMDEACRLLCPNAEVAVYSFPFGETIDEAVSMTGELYRDLPNASKFAQSYESSCACRPRGSSWAEALAAAEKRYGHGSRDILVTVEAAERMSRPAATPVAKSAVPKAETPDPPPGLDVNGVDTSLTAAAATISRENSGIKDDTLTTIVHFGLKQGRIVEDAGPDGAPHKVRILTPTF
jgi:Protein of unknown function (DUF2865)